jgi:hypothetical protein
MPYLLQYLIKFSISLAVLYLFYITVLRPLTFYQWNRFYLLCYSLLSFFIPFIHIDSWINKPALQATGIIKIIPSISSYSNGNPAIVNPHGIISLLNWYQWVLAGVGLGCIIMLARTILQLLSLRRVQKTAQLINKEGAVHFYETHVPISPFSFGNSIYFNSSLHSHQELESIIRHEYVHVKQKHSVDLMLAETLCIINWYNPFAWLIRFSIRQNLEFIADSKVLANGLDKKEYQYLLLKVLGLPQYRIANNFNISNLKKRIVMMNRLKTARLQLARFLFVLPLLAVLLLAFRGNDRVAAKQHDKIAAALKLLSSKDTIPVPPPPVPPAIINSAPKLEADVKSAPPPPPAVPLNMTIPGKNTGLIQSMEIFSDTNNIKKTNIKVIKITLKDGTKETYNLGNPKEKAAFTEKYGSLPAAPLPPTAPLAPINKSQIKLSGSKIQLNSLQQSNILIVLNGVEQPLGTNLNTINPEDIESVDVLKNETGLANYGEKGKNGVIKIKTKNGIVAPYKAAHEDTLTVVADSIWFNNSHMQIANAKMSINGNEANLTGDLGFTDFQNNMPLVFYNGKEVTELKTFKLENASLKILSLNPASAKEKYGERAKYGALLITPN